MKKKELLTIFVLAVLVAGLSWFYSSGKECLVYPWGSQKGRLCWELRGWPLTSWYVAFPLSSFLSAIKSFRPRELLLDVFFWFLVLAVGWWVVKKLKMQKSKLRIELVGLLAVGVILAGGWWVWNSWIKEKRPISEQKVTCDQKCISLGYASGVCRTFPVLPNATKCKEDEIDIGHTIDCQPPTKDKEPIGGGGWACCCKVKERIQKVTIATDKTEYEQGRVVKIIIKNETNNTKWIHYPFWIVENFEEGGWKKINRVLCPCGVSCRIPPHWELESNRTIKDEWDQKETWCKEGMPSISEATVSQQVGPGKYRLKLLVSDAKQDAPQKTIYSNEFTVKEKPTVQKDPRCLMPKPTEIGGCKVLRGFYYDASSNECEAIGGCEVVGEIPFSAVQKQECIQLCVEK